MPAPVTDVDRAKELCTERVGFHADNDHQLQEVLCFVQLTPPGSTCSIVLGTGITEMTPGSQQGLQLALGDIDAARAELVKRGSRSAMSSRCPGGSVVFFSDPDGNGWTVQDPSTA